MATQETINKMLESYGHSPTGSPIFRIVWSDDQFEMRKGVFEEQTKESKIYLRTVTETRKTRKYPYIRGRWIFEKWYPSPEIWELPDSKNGIYECIYVFQDKNARFLSLDEEIVQFIAHALIKIVDKSKNKQILEELALKQEMRIDELDALELEEASPLLATQLHIGEAVSFTNMKKEKNE